MEKQNGFEELKREIERLRAEVAEERAKKEFLQSAIEALPNPIFIKNAQAKFVFFNKKYEEFFGMNQEEYVGKSVLELPFLPPEDRERYQQEDLVLIENSSLLHYEVDYLSGEEVCPSFYWSRGFKTPETGEKGLVGEIVNISKEKHLEKQLKINIEQLELANRKMIEASKKDALTGVFNRRFLGEQEQIFADVIAPRMNSIYFLMIDLDHFKKVNDDYGHLAGDQVLADFAKILRESCRETDLPFRYGGEEFLVFLYNVDMENAEKIAERVRLRCVNELLRPDGKSITVSIGISKYHEGDSLNECIAHADAALYCAKEAGRNRVVAEDLEEEKNLRG